MNATKLSRLNDYLLQLGDATTGHDQDAHRIARAIVASAKDGCPESVLISQTARMMNTFRAGTEAWAKLGCLQSILVGRSSWAYVARCISGN